MKTVHLTAHGIKVDDDEGRFCLVIETQYGEDDEMLLQVDIHDEVLEFYAAMRREIGPYAAEADSARRAVAAGVSLTDYTAPQPVTNRPVSVEDAIEAGYALDDPKSPGYHDRMVGDH